MATILIIDDQEPVRILLRAVLERAGYEVREACNGRHGLELYREKSADLIITDIIMPEMNGLEMLSELTRSFPNVKVIAISGGSPGDGVLSMAKMLGALHTFYKPLDLEKLVSAVACELTMSA